MLTRFTRSLVNSFFVTVILATSMQPIAISAGVLDDIRSEVRDESKDERNTNERDGHRDRDRSSLTSLEDTGGPFWNIAFYAVTSPFWVPRSLVEGELSGNDSWFTRAPYVDSVGSMSLDESPQVTKPWFVRFQFEYGLGSKDVSHTRIRVQSDLIDRFGIDTEAFFLSESLSDGARDRLQNGDINLVYRFAQNEKWQFRSGLGYNWLHDNDGTDHGINFTYGVDWYPRDPLFASATVDLGSLGRTNRTHTRVVFGVTRKGFGAYTGYDGLRIGGAKIDSWVNGIEYRW